MMLSELIRAGLEQMSLLPGWGVLLAKVTVLLAITWLVHFGLSRANPRWRVLVWRGAVAGLTLLMIWEAGLPQWRVYVSLPRPTAAVPNPALPPAVPETAAADRQSPDSLPIEKSDSAEFVMLPVQYSDANPVPAAAAVPVESPSQRPSWPAVAVVVWGLVAGVLLMRLTAAYLRFSRLLAGFQKVPATVLAEVRRVAEAISPRSGGIANLDVRCSPRFPVPFVCGLWRPVLVLPERMCQPACHDQLQATLAHELAHVGRSDFRWSMAAEVATIAFWIHPLAWRIASAHRSACDAVCDAVSASYLGDVRAYCRVLAEVALEAAPAGATAGLAMARTCDVRRRIRALQRKVFAAAPGRSAITSFVLTGSAVLVLLAGLRFALAAPQGTEPDPAAATAAESAVSTMAVEAAEPVSRSMQVHVVDTDGKPIAEANIAVRVTGASGPARYRTDAGGDATIALPGTAIKSLELLVYTDRHVTEGASWRAEAVDVAPPKEHTFTLEPGSMVGGIVRSAKGEPIAGAEVTVHGKKAFHDNPRWRSINDTVKSDEEGKWLSRRVPKDLIDFRFTIEIKHPDFMSLKLFENGDLPVEELRKGNAEAVMREGIAVEGTVTDPSGKPVAGALVGQFVEQFASTCPRATTDDQGRYRLPPCGPGQYLIAVAADGYVPNSREVNVNGEAGPLDLQLRDGAPIRLRVVDENGRPVAEAAVSHVLDRQILFLDNTREAASPQGRNLHADSEGRWSKLWIPGDELTFYISKDGYETVQKNRLAPNEKEQVVTLKAGRWIVAGRVVDSETKAPITEFRITEGVMPSRPGEPHMWYMSDKVSNARGEYRATWDYENERRVIRIEAYGYYASAAKPVGKAGKQVAFNVELRRSSSIAGMVRGPDGKLLGGADVVLCTPGRGLYLRNGRPGLDQYPLLVQTGSDGRFSFPPQEDPYLVVAMHELGFAQVFDKEKIRDITLQPWARVEGRLLIGNKPGVDEKIVLDFDDLFGRPLETLTPQEQAARRIHHDYSTQTDEDGRFVFDRVCPGSAKVCRQILVSQQGGMTGWTATDRRAVSLVAGQTVNVELKSTDKDEARRRTPDTGWRTPDSGDIKKRAQARAEANAERTRRVDAAMKVLQETRSTCRHRGRA